MADVLSAGIQNAVEIVQYVVGDVYGRKQEKWWKDK